MQMHMYMKSHKTNFVATKFCKILHNKEGIGKGKGVTSFGISAVLQTPANPQHQAWTSTKPKDVNEPCSLLRTANDCVQARCSAPLHKQPVDNQLPITLSSNYAHVQTHCLKQQQHTLIAAA